MTERLRKLLITDLDNTLWDWFESWHQSFSALLDGLVSISGLDRAFLEDQIKTVHRKRGTTEYSNLVREVPALVEFSGSRDPMDVFDSALHAQNSRRLSATRLYPGVFEGLNALRETGVHVVAYTESGAFWTEWRMRHTGLDGIIDVLYSSPDHDLAAGVKLSELRSGHYDEENYGLRRTKHRHAPPGAVKPNLAILNTILESQDCESSDAVYLGDSLMKDITMAQAAHVLDVHAAYGLVQHRQEYDLLKRVTHWTEDDVAREKALSAPVSEVEPSIVCRDGFMEILPIFGLASESAR